MSNPLEQLMDPPHSPHGEPIPRDYFSLHPLELPQDELEPEEPNEGDIYRGGHSPTRPESISSSSSSSSTSSSSSSVFGGRLGAISTLVEHAIARWARARASTSSLDSASTASSSTVSSIVTVSRSYLSRRRRRRSSVADIHNARSEREIAARIRAREEARQVPREFVLYTPGAAAKPRLPRDERSGVVRTASLPLILGELNVALKANFRTRRAQDLARAGAGAPSSHTPPQATPPGNRQPVFLLPQQDYMMPQASEEEAAYRKRGRKGKQRATPELAVSETPPLSRAPSVSQLNRLNRAWWLDVSSPTWEDMRALGKLLHLHPLTLEDILQQEPREKLELFPRLGYYFVVFKAIESEKTREKRRFMSTISTTDTRSVHYDEGLIGEGNVYLVIFREGIITFHFSDISEHTDAVRNKVLMYVESGGPTMSSDWIAHGIMDSIVDSFFPFLDKIEKEVIDIENSVSTEEQAMDVPQEDSRGASQVSTSATLVSNTSGDVEKESSKTASPVIVEKVETRPPPRTQFSLPKTPLLTSHRLKHAIRKLRHALSQVDLRVKRTPTSNVSTPTAIQRVARMRRLVTSLARVLATKSEVVASVKKRLLMTGESGLGNGTVDDQDVFVYMGDVQDHILTLQQALAHYERMLNQSQPIYLTHLRLSASKAKSGSDKGIVILSIISMAVLVSQAVIGVFSMNVHVPRSNNSFAVFGVVISITVTVLCIYIAVVRWWWVRALKKRRRW